MIAKNEQRHLPRCLASVRDLVDDIVIVDTGSSDDTAAIARSFGARVLHREWTDDFSAARNAGLEHATGEWLLMLDADESIAARDHHHIRELMRRDDLHAVTSTQRHYLTSATVGWKAGPGGYDEGVPYPGYVDVTCRRLFRNRPWLRFRHAVHEELVSIDPRRPLVQEHAGWVIHHFGKLDPPAGLRAKSDMYLRIGLTKVQEQPDNPLAHYELGIQYAERGEPEAAHRCFERVLALSPRFRDTALRVGLCYAQGGRHAEALAALREAARLLPELAGEAATQEGTVHRALNDEAAAEEAFRRALRLNPELAVAGINLARLLERQGRHDEALACLTRFEAHPDALRRRARLLSQARRFEEARACLDRLPDCRDAAVESLRGAVALGLGDLDAAVAHTRRSLEIGPSLEAALNLSAALQARGELADAMRAAGEAARLSPREPAVRARMHQLMAAARAGVGRPPEGVQPK